MSAAQDEPKPQVTAPVPEANATAFGPSIEMLSASNVAPQTPAFAPRY